MSDPSLPTRQVQPPPTPNYQFRLDGKRALITGASRGMGREAAKAFARLGASVAISGRTRSALDELAAEIKAEGGSASVLIADLGKVEQAERLPEQAADVLGGLDVLVNNAGGAAAYIPGGSTGLLDTPPAVFEDLFRLNLLSAYAVTRSAATIMRDAGRSGSIINNTSIQGLFPTWNLGPYAATKAGLQAFTSAWAEELGPHQVRVNAIAPGGVITGNLQRLIEDPAQRAEREAKIPMGWLAVPEDAAACMVFLASDESRWVSGATILLSGGRPR